MTDLRCDLCGGESAAMLMTNAATGDVIAVGETCLFPFYVGAAGGLAEGMPEEVKAEYREVVSNLAAAVGATAPPTASGATKVKGRRSAAAPADNGGEASQGGSGQPGAVDAAEDERAAATL